MAHQDLRCRKRLFAARNIAQEKHFAHTSDAPANTFDSWWCRTAAQRTAIVAQASTIIREYVRIVPVGCATDGHAH